jgi:hypothetical protein
VSGQCHAQITLHLVKNPIIQHGRWSGGGQFYCYGLEDKRILDGVSACKCCLNLKRELKEVQEELSSVKLNLEVLQKEDTEKEHKGYGTIEPRNLIQCNDLKVGKNHTK